MSRYKELLKKDVKQSIKRANKELNNGNIEEARVILNKLQDDFPAMNNYCRENYKKALTRAGLSL